MNFIERFVIRRTHNIKRSTTRLNNQEIDRFAKKILEINA